MELKKLKWEVPELVALSKIANGAGLDCDSGSGARSCYSGGGAKGCTTGTSPFA